VTVSEHEERLWPPDKIRRLPRFHALLFRQNMEPQPVYCAPYYSGGLDRVLGIRGRYDPDPYHPAAAPKRRQFRRVAGIAALSAAIAGGAWLASTAGHGGTIWPSNVGTLPGHLQTEPAPVKPGAIPPTRV
jgi:hypothetical protein